MFQERARTVQGFSLGLDALCICLAFAAAVILRALHASLPVLSWVPAEPWTRAHLVPSDFAIQLAANLFVWLAFLRRSRLYVDGGCERLGRVLAVYLRGFALMVLSTSLVVFALQMEISRLLFVYFFALSLGLLVAKQTVFIGFLSRVRTSWLHRRHVLVVGSATAASGFVRVLRSAVDAGYDLIGVILPGDAETANDPEVPVVGRLNELDSVLAHHPVDEVFIVGSATEMARLAPVAQELIERGRVVSLVSTLASDENGVRGRITNFIDVPMISYGPMPRDEFRSGTKRTIDVAVSAVALALLSPLMLSVAALIKLFDPGPLLFSQERLGWQGRRFRVYKFRSMRADAEQVLRASPELYERYVGSDFKLPEDEDPRISPLGRFLRRSSLDELPQLWNVLRGDMTLVGPRPIVPDELKNYRPYESLFLSVKPGLTGRWQTSGRSDVRYPQRAFLDLDYIGDHSIVTDIGILAQTVPSVLRGRGAH